MDSCRWFNNHIPSNRERESEIVNDSIKNLPLTIKSIPTTIKINKNIAIIIKEKISSAENILIITKKAISNIRKRKNVEESTIIQSP
jgi:hypothetical protein